MRKIDKIIKIYLRQVEDGIDDFKWLIYSHLLLFIQFIWGKIIYVTRSSQNSRPTVVFFFSFSSTARPEPLHLLQIPSFPPSIFSFMHSSQFTAPSLFLCPFLLYSSIAFYVCFSVIYRLHFIRFVLSFRALHVH